MVNSTDQIKIDDTTRWKQMIETKKETSPIFQHCKEQLWKTILILYKCYSLILQSYFGIQT